MNHKRDFVACSHIIGEIPAPALLFRKDETVVYYNAALETLFHLPPAGTSPLPLSELLPVHVARRILAAWKELPDHSLPMPFLYEGSTFTLRIASIPNETFPLYLTLFEKEWDRDRLHEELQFHLSSMEKAQEIARMGNWDWDITTGSLWWSRQIYTIFGLNPDDFGATYEAFLNTIHPRDRSMVKEAVRRAVDLHEPYQVRHRILQPDGNELVVQEQGVVLYDEKGKPVRMVGTVHDISDSVSTEERLLLADQVLENTMDGIVITDDTTAIVRVNPAFARMTGYQEEEVLGKKVSLLQSGWHDDDFYRSMWESIEKNGSWTGEIWDRKKSGELYAAELTIFRVTGKFDGTVHYVAISNDITEKKETEKKIIQLAHMDFLTGLPNRSRMQEHITQRIELAAYSDESFAVFFLDLDNFKTLNDTLGHQAGDRVLRVIGNRIKDVLGNRGAIARTGGDEFLGLINTIHTPADAGKVIQDIEEEIMRPVEIDGSVFTLGVSAGISLYPDDAKDFGTLIQNAESAMYHAKDLGRGTYRFFTESMYITARDRLDLEHKLRNALNNNEMFLQYQPKVCLQSRQLLGMEALLRWKNEALGAVSPARFIPIAEEIGVILSLGLWVLKQSCREIRPLLKHYPRIRLSVNVSGRQLYEPGFYEGVIATLQETDFPSENLELEITESIILKNESQAIRLLEKIRRAGISLALDDFGTGYSSLSVLKQLPVHTLKIDRNFVKDLGIDSGDEAFIRAILSLAKSLDLKAVAEGAEKEEQVEILRQEGCDAVQGYYFAKPMGEAEFFEYVRKEWKQNTRCE